MQGEIKLSTRALFGYILLTVGLILMIYIIVNAFLLANGVFQPLRLSLSAIQEVQVLLGIATQLGSYALITSVAGILMANGVRMITSGK